MELNITGLKCDHCDYRDDSVQFSDFATSIGKPCPDCGESLLTQEDYNQCLRLYATVEKAKAIGRVLRWLNPFFYWRLIFGDNRKYVTFVREYKNIKK